MSDVRLSVGRSADCLHDKAGVRQPRASAPPRGRQSNDQSKLQILWGRAMAKRKAVAKLIGSVRGDGKAWSSHGEQSESGHRSEVFLGHLLRSTYTSMKYATFWAQTIGISKPQWMILITVAELDRGHGVPVKDVSTMLHVDPSFVTTQSKLLEKYGFVRRITSSL